jgi:hypothetical protein
VILDTIPPTIMLDPEWAYTDQEVSDMYRTFYGWVQYNANNFVDTYQWDSVVYDIPKSTTYMNIITLPDTVRQDWWWGTL